MVSCVPGGRARSTLATGPGQRFADVRWVAETGSTNADAMELARQGEPEGIVLVADHQTAGRGRAGRTWTTPPRAALTASFVLRPDVPREAYGWAPLVAGLATVRALRRSGIGAYLKWPNDVVVEHGARDI